MGSTVQIWERRSKCSSAISESDIGFYVLPESLCLSLIESNLEGDRSQGVAALGPPSYGAGSGHGWLCLGHRTSCGRWELRLGKWTSAFGNREVSSKLSYNFSALSPMRNIKSI